MILNFKCIDCYVNFRSCNSCNSVVMSYQIRVSPIFKISIRNENLSSLFWENTTSSCWKKQVKKITYKRRKLYFFHDDILIIQIFYIAINAINSWLICYMRFVCIHFSFIITYSKQYKSLKVFLKVLIWMLVLINITDFSKYKWYCSLLLILWTVTGLFHLQKRIM